jgi:hypothetical protein
MVDSLSRPNVELDPNCSFTMAFITSIASIITVNNYKLQSRVPNTTTHPIRLSPLH